MQVHAIGNGAYAAYISGAELKIRNIAPDHLEKMEKKELLELFSPQLKEAEGRQATLEIFPGREGVLLFLRFAAEKPVFFAFSSLDPLLDAVSECRENMPARLDHFGGAYILTLFPGADSAAADAFGEFGARLPYPEGFFSHMCEHGRMLIVTDALLVLRRAFHV